MTDSENSELARVHERLDDLLSASNRIENRVNLIDQRVEPLCEQVKSHQVTLHGNGKDGLVERMGVVETGRTDTLSVKSMVTLIGAIGVLAATIGGAMAALVK